MTKVFVLGLDSLEPSLIDKWVKSGKLPTFKRLMKEGSYGPLRSTVHPLTSPAWCSFMTGKNPGKHGVFDFVEVNKDYEQYVASKTPSKARTLWKYLTEKNKKVVVLNVPLTYPLERVNGVLISGFTTPSETLPYVYPRYFKNLLKEAIPEYSVDPKRRFSVNPKEKREYLDELFRVVDMREKTMYMLLKAFEWDFFMAVFMGADHIQHAFWKEMDKSHPQHDPKDPKAYQTAIERMYVRFDKLLAKLLKKLPKDVSLYVISDNGHGPLHASMYVNQWLQEQGYLKLKRTPLSLLHRALFNVGITPKNMYSFLSKTRLIRYAKKLPRKYRQGAMNAATVSFKDVDWKRTVAFSDGHFGRIFINKKGKYREGWVKPGKQYERIRNKIVKDLRAINHPSRKGKLVTKVWKPEETYKGPHTERAADIIFAMDDYKYSTQMDFSFATKELFSEHIHARSGDHRSHGVVFTKGPGKTNGKKLKAARLIDIYPSVLKDLGLPLPKDLDGTPLR